MARDSYDKLIERVRELTEMLFDARDGDAGCRAELVDHAQQFADAVLANWEKEQGETDGD